MLKITHRKYVAETAQLERVQAHEYQQARSHPERAPKDRSEMQEVAVKVRSCTARRARERSMRQFVLTEAERVKVVGYTGRNQRPATTGTSRPGRLCVTDGMSSCVAVAIAGERPAASGPGGGGDAKVRVFHIYPHNIWRDDIEAYVAKLRAVGLEPRAALHGAEEIWTASDALPRALRATFERLRVPIAFDETYDKMSSASTPLGAVIDPETKKPRFITELITPR